MKKEGEPVQWIENDGRVLLLEARTDAIPPHLQFDITGTLYINPPAPKKEDTRQRALSPWLGEFDRPYWRDTCNMSWAVA